jgi:hypothetical protein
MKGRSLSDTILRFVALVGLLFVLYAIDFYNLSVSQTVRAAPFALFAVAFLDTAVIVAAISRLRYTGWRLIATVFLFIYGLKTFLVAIEGIYLSDVLTPAMVRTLFINGLIVAALFAPAAVWAFGRWTAGERTGKKTEVYGELYEPRSFIGWGLRLAVAGIAYLLLFIAGGLLVFTPVAAFLDPAQAAAYSAAFEAPVWLPLFVIARGALWALLALPAIHGLTGSFWTQALTIGFLFAVLMADSMFLADTLPGAIRIGHFVELFAENFLFGLVLVRLLRQRPKEQVLAPSFSGD